MKLKKVKTKDEQYILTAMITNERFLREIQPILQINLFKSKSIKTLVQWVQEYYKQHKSNPGIHIEEIFNDKVSKGHIQEDKAEHIARILEKLSKEYERAEQLNTDYYLKRAEKYISSRYMEKLAKHINDNVEKDPEEAKKILDQYKVPKLPSSEGINVFSDVNLLRKVFEESQKPLFKFKGALGTHLNDQMKRGNFIGIMGMEKAGKSWHLMEFAYTAYKQRCNVAYFQAGDMDDVDLLERIAVRQAGRPIKKKYQNQFIPVYDCEYNQKDTCALKHRSCNVGIDICDNDSVLDDLLKEIGKSYQNKKELIQQAEDDGYLPCSYCRRKNPKKWKGSIWWKEEKLNPLTYGDSLRAIKKFRKRRSKTGFKLRSYAAGTLSCREIEDQLNRWIEQENFIPDVIVVDYADDMTSNEHEERHKQHKIWQGLRGLAHKFNGLVITATQVKSTVYNKRNIELQDYSEDKRKYGKVTCMITLNQQIHEKITGILRIGVILVRKDEFDSREQVHVLQNLSIANPHIGSFY